MHKKRILFYESTARSSFKSEPEAIVDVDNLYKSFYDDFKRVTEAIEFVSALINRQPIWTVVDGLVERAKNDRCDDNRTNLEVGLSGLFSSYVGVLRMLESYTSRSKFKRVKDMLYNENATFRLMYEIKYIFRPRKPIKLYTRDGAFYLNIPETISDHEVSEERFERAFKGLDDVNVDTLWHDYKRTQNRLIEYLIIATISEKQLRKFYNCVKVYEKPDDMLMVATQEGIFTFNERINIEKTRDLLRVYENIPVSDRNKIARLFNECE